MNKQETMPGNVGEWRHDPDPIKRAIYWLVDASWVGPDDFDELQELAKKLWEERARKAAVS